MRVVLLFLIAFAPRFAPAQESVNYASLGGRITDASGAVVAGTSVTARRDRNQLFRPRPERTPRDATESRTSPWDTTRIRIHKDGFADLTRTLSLTVGSAFDLSVQLTLGSQETTLIVGSEGPLIEAARSQIAGTVSQAEVSGLPLNGRNYLDLALLIPGVSPTNTVSNQLFAETSEVPGQGLSIGSQRNFLEQLHCGRPFRE